MFKKKRVARKKHKKMEKRRKAMKQAGMALAKKKK